MKTPTVTTLHLAAEDIGKSKQPALSPVFKKVAPLLVAPFQKAMRGVGSPAKKKIFKTYFGKVNLGDKPMSPKNKKMLRDILTDALRQDRGWLEFVAEQILDGSAPELAAVLGGDAVKAKTEKGKSKKASLVTANEYTSPDDYSSVGQKALATILDLGLAFPVVINVDPKDYNGKAIFDKAKAKRLALGGTTITLDDEDDIETLVDALVDVATDRYQLALETAEGDAKLYADEAGLSEEDWAAENLYDYTNSENPLGPLLLLPLLIKEQATKTAATVDDEGAMVSAVCLALDDAARFCGDVEAYSGNISSVLEATKDLIDDIDHLLSVYVGFSEGELDNYYTGVRMYPTESADKGAVKRSGQNALKDIEILQRDHTVPPTLAPKIRMLAVDIKTILHNMKLATAKVTTAKLSVESLAEGSYPESSDIEALGLEYPVSLGDIGGASDVLARLRSSARDLGFLEDINDLVIPSEDGLYDLFAALEESAYTYEKETEKTLQADAEHYAEQEGTTTEEWFEANYNEYMSDVHDPAIALLQMLGR